MRHHYAVGLPQILVLHKIVHEKSMLSLGIYFLGRTLIVIDGIRRFLVELRTIQIYG